MPIFVIAAENPGQLVEKLSITFTDSEVVTKLSPETTNTPIIISRDLSSFTTMENTWLMKREGSLILVIDEKQAAEFKKSKFVFMTSEYYEQAKNEKFVLLRGKLHHSGSEFLFEDMVANIKNYILAVQQMKDRHRNG